MQSFKYFTYGYPRDSQSAVYGLYQPVLNCFLLILPDYFDVGPQLTAILSSRYMLQPIRISCASNYTHNIIDNEVCQNWAISNLHQVPARSLMINFKMIDAEQLIPATVSIAWDIEKEKQWAQFCVYWLRYIKLVRKISYCGGWIDEQIGNNPLFNIFDPLAQPDVIEFAEQVTTLLYLGQDLATTEQAIMSLVNSHKLFQQYLEHK
jgi:hypothetical protein